MHHLILSRLIGAGELVERRGQIHAMRSSVEIGMHGIKRRLIKLDPGPGADVFGKELKDILPEITGYLIAQGAAQTGHVLVVFGWGRDRVQPQQEYAAHALDHLHLAFFHGKHLLDEFRRRIGAVISLASRPRSSKLAPSRNSATWGATCSTSASAVASSRQPCRTASRTSSSG